MGDSSCDTPAVPSPLVVPLLLGFFRARCALRSGLWETRRLGYSASLKHHLAAASCEGSEHGDAVPVYVWGCTQHQRRGLSVGKMSTNVCD